MIYKPKDPKKPTIVYSERGGFKYVEPPFQEPVKPPSVLDGTTTLKEALYRSASSVKINPKDNYVSPGESLDAVLRDIVNRR
jgi:hypothetical protein